MSTSTGSTTSGYADGRHRVNVGHLVMGLAFLCFTAGWALVQADVVTGSDIRWLLPLPWLVAGAAGLAAVAVGSLRRSTQDNQQDPQRDIQHDTTTLEEQS